MFEPIISMVIKSVSGEIYHGIYQLLKKSFALEYLLHIVSQRCHNSILDRIECVLIITAVINHLQQRRQSANADAAGKSNLKAILW